MADDVAPAAPETPPAAAPAPETKLFKIRVGDKLVGLRAPADIPPDALKRKALQAISPPGAELPAIGAAKGEHAMLGATPQPGTAPPALQTFGNAVLQQAPEIAFSIGMGSLAPLAEKSVAGRLPALAGAASRFARPLLTALGGAGGLTGQSMLAGQGVPAASSLMKEALLAGGTDFVLGEGGRLLFSPKKAQELAGTLRGKFAPATRGLTQAGQQAAEGDINTELQGLLPSLASEVRTQTQRMYGRISRAGRSIAPIGTPTSISKSIQDIDAVTHGEFTGDAKKVLQDIEERVTSSSTRTLNPQTGRPESIPPQPIQFNELLDWERRLRDLEPTDFAKRLHPDEKTTGIISNLRRQVSQEIEAAAATSPETSAALREAKDFFKSEVIPFREMSDHTLSRQVGPNDVIDVLTRQGRSDRLVAFMKRLAPEQQTMVRTSWFSQKLRESTDDLDVFDARTFLKSWKQLGHQNQELIAGTSGAEIGKAIQSLHTDIRRQTLKKTGARIAKIGGVVETLREASSAFQRGNVVEAGGILATGGAATLVLPSLLSTPRMVRWWNLGHEATPGSQIAVRAGRAIALTLAHSTAALTQHAHESQAEAPSAPAALPP